MTESVTIKYLYKRAKELGCEDKPLMLHYYCNDDWYNLIDYHVQKNDIIFEDGKLNITIMEN